jgi:hypothetical protein
MKKRLIAVAATMLAAALCWCGTAAVSAQATNGNEWESGNHQLRAGNGNEWEKGAPAANGNEWEFFSTSSANGNEWE